MKKNGKSKFIIGLSTAVMGGILATGQAAYASDAPAVVDHTNTTDLVDNTYVDYTLVGDNDAAGVEKATTTDETTLPSQEKVIEVDQGAVTKELDTNEPDTNHELNQKLEEVTDLNGEDKAETTNETEQTDTAENTDQASEGTSKEEALLTEPSATPEDPAEVEEAEEPSTSPTAEEDTATETEENLDTEVEAGVVVEEGPDTASTEAELAADSVDEAPTEKAPVAEENTEATNKETADVANTEQKDDEKTSADAPQETPAGEGPDATTIAKLSEEQIGKVENPLETDANVASTNDVVTEDDPLTGENDTADGSGEGDPDKEVEVDFGAETTSEEGEKELTIQTFALGNFPLTEEGAELPNPHLENINMLSADLVEAGAESSAGDVNIAVKEGYTDPEADAAKIENKRETNLTPGDTVESGGKNDFVDPKDGFQATVIEPKNDSKDKRLYGYEFIIDKKTGQRTYTRIEASSGVVRTSPATLGDKPMMEKGDKLSESSPEVTYKATGTSTLSPGSQNVYGYRASEEDLMHINNKDNDSTVLGMKDYYTRDNATGSKVLDNVNVVFNVNPWPDENDNLERIRLQGNYDENKKVYVHGQEIDTGLKVENLDENARDRLTAKVYNPENGEIVPGAEVYIDGEGNVKVKLPDGAVDTNGKINKKSIFYDDPKFNGAQSLDVKLYARPRKAEEFQNVANLSWFAPGTYTDTGAGTTEITHNGNKVEIANQGIDRYDHYNLIGEFEIKLDDESNYDIITNDKTANKLVTDKVLRLKAGVDKEIEQVDNPNSTAPHKYTTAITDKAVDSYLEEEYKEYLIPVEGEENKYRTEDNWLVEVDPDNPQNMKVSTPIGAKKGENLTLAVTHLFTNGSEKNFLMNFVVKEESIEKPNYKVAVTEAGEEVTNTPTNEYTKTKPKPVKYELESTSIVDDNGKTWTLSIDENSGVITATAPGEIDDKVSTINVPVIATYVDQNLKDINGKDLVYTERSNATFTATAPQEGEVRYSQDNIIEYETIVRYNPDKDPTESGVVQEGKNGKSTADYTVTYKNGEVVAGPTMVEGTEKVTVKPTDQIFEIGTKGASVDVTAPDEQTIKIPYTTEIIYDENQPVGYRKETPGEDGEKKITYEITQENGKATVTATETTTKEVTPRRIVIGTKPSELGVDFNPEIDVKVDNTKDVGSVDTEVVQGEYKTVTKNVQNPDGSVVTIEEVVEITKPKQIITVGTKDYTGDVSHTDKKEVPFEVKYEYTDQLDAGVTELKNDGVLGEKTVTYTVPVINGKKDPNKEITSEETQTKDPVDKVILVGTRPVEKTIEIPFETEYVYDSSLDAGQTVIDENNPGVTGQKKVTTSFNQTTNDIEVTEETVTEAQKRIVRVGGKTTGSQTLTEKVPFTVEIRENPALKKGEYNVVQDGVVGEKEKILTIENSTVTNTTEGRTITEAKNQIIEVGSADFTGEVSHEVTEEVPFTVKIVEDSTMAPGTHKVVTEGQAGSKTTRYTQNIVNGAADGELKSEEIVTATTKAPVEEVIHVGTATINSQNTATSGDIPVDITYTYDPTKERGTAEKGAFTPGKVETKIVNQYNPETGKIETKTEETVTNAKQEIIVGTKDYTGTFTHEERRVTPFETQIVHDPNLKAGETVTDQIGVNGVETRIITQKFTNGDIAEKSYSDWTTVSEVKNEIIRVGSLTEGTKKHEEAIPFDYKVEYDPTIPAGEYRITQEGKDGKRTTEWTIKNSQVVGEPTVTEEDPVNAIIKVGNKDFTGVATHTETFTIPYKVVIRENPELPVGTRKTVQEGTDGSYKITYKQDIKNGNTVGELTRTESDRVEVQNQIIEVGSKPVDDVKERINKEVNVTVEYRPDPNLPKGQTRTGELTPGKVEHIVTTTFDPASGKMINNVEERTTDAKQIIYVGAQDLTGPYTYEIEKTVPFKTEYVNDPNLEAGEQRLEKAGEDGIKIITVTGTVVDGEVKDSANSERITKDPVTQIIRVGTKTNVANTKVTHEENRTIEYTTEIQYDDSLPVGTRKTIQEGKNGESIFTYTTDVVDGKPGETKVSEIVITPVQKEIILVGTKEAQNVNEEYTEAIPYETKITYDDSKPLGYKEETAGTAGSRKVTVTSEMVNGEIKTTRNEEVITPATDKTVVIGTKPIEKSVEYIDKSIDNVEIEIVNDPTLAKGTVIEGDITPGRTYSVVESVYNKETGEIDSVERTIVIPPKRTITVGTKDYTGTFEHDEVEITPYKTIIEINPNLKAGEKEVTQEGINGKRERTVKQSFVNGEKGEKSYSDWTVVDKVQDEIITVGTMTEGTNKYEEEIPFKYVVDHDPNLKAGEIKVEKAGKVGKRTVEWTVKNSEVVGNPVTTVIEEAEDAIIKVGNKDYTGIATHTEEFVIPYTIEIRENNTLPLGTRNVIENGENGSYKVTYEQDIINGETKGEVRKTESDRKAAKNQVIEVGTKPITPVEEDYSDTVNVTVKYELDYDLEKGQYREGELTPGKVDNVVTTIYDPQTGELKTVANKNVTNATQVVYIGAKGLEGPLEYTITKDIPYTTIYEYDPNMEAGKTEVTQVGENGTKVIKVTGTVVDGKVTDPKDSEEVTKEAKAQIIKIGTKSVNVTTNVVKNPVPFETVFEEDDTLPAGKAYVSTPGENGVEETTITTTYTNGTPEVKEETKTTKEPVKQVVKVGTKVAKADVDNKDVIDIVKAPIPFKTEITYDNSLEAGEEIETQKGEDGERTIVVKLPIVEGKAGDFEIISDGITKEATPRKVTIGTKKTNVNTEVKETVVPFDTEIVFDETLDDGSSTVTQEGKVGIDTTTTKTTVVNGQELKPEITTERTQEPTKQIITVGTRKDGTYSHTEEIPFEVKIEKVSSLKKGEVEVVTEGQKGSRTTTWTIVNSKVDETKTTTSEKAPVNAVIKVGTADYTGKVEHKAEEVVPYKIVIQENPNLAIGKRNTLVEGKDGLKETKYTINLVNGEVSGEIESELTKDYKPVDQVIEIGTKPVTNIDKTIDTPLNPEFNIVYDDTKDKGTVEVGQLTPGKVETKITQTFNPETGQMESKEETVVTNPTQTITIGTKDLIGNQNIEFIKDVPYETEYIEDNTIEAGQKEIEQEGKIGKKVVTVVTEVKNGSVVDTKLTEKITEEPVKQIIRVGTRSEKTDTEVVKESIPFEIEYKYDNTLAAGTYEVDNEGELGEKVVTTTTTIVNGTETTEVTDEKTTKDPVKRVVRIGTKIDRETKNVVSTETYEIPFETKVTYDPNLKAGEEIVKVQGENGSRTVTVTVPVVEGKAGEPVVEDKVTKEPITREVVIGTMDTSTNTSTVISVTKEEIPFEIEYVKDDTLAAGETKVETVGKNGKKITTTTLVNENGKSETKTEETTEDAVKQVVKIGTKVAAKEDQVIEKEFTQEIPYATEIEYDDQLAAGTEKVIQDGKAGTRNIKVKIIVKEGVASDPEVTDTTTAPTPKKIKIGTMKTDTVTTVTETIKPFETEIVYDNTMDKGTSKVTQTGVNGKEIKTTVTTVINGKAQENPVVTTSSTEPTKQIITVGTKCPDTTTTVDTVVDKLTPYEVTIIYDNTLDKGTEAVVTEGRVGIVRETHSVEVKNGVAGESRITKTETIQEKQDKVIRIGTKPTTPTTSESPKPETKDVVSSKTVSIPFTTRIVKDPNLDAGKIVEDQKGVPGKKTVTITIPITNGVAGEAKVEVKETIAPVERVIRVGTKKSNPTPSPKPNNGGTINPSPAPNKDDEAPSPNEPVRPVRPTEDDTIISRPTDPVIIDIPFNTVVITDNDLPEGETKLVLKGIDGEGYVNENGDIVVTRQPVDEIVRVGVKPIEENIAVDDSNSNEEVKEPSNANTIDENTDEITDDAEVDEEAKTTEETVEETHEEETNDSDTAGDKDGDETDIENELENDDDSSAIRKVENDESELIDDMDEIDVTRTATSSNKVPSSNPKTGIAGSSKVLATLALAMGGFYASKKKEDEEDK